MLIDLKELVTKYSLNIKGIIQVGAHHAEEHDVFKKLDVRHIIYFEPCADAYKKMLAKIGGAHFSDSSRPASNGDICDGLMNRDGSTMFFNMACGSSIGEYDMFVAPFNQGQSNSLLMPQLHLEQHPEVQFTQTERVKVVTLDSIPFDRPAYNLLMMDVQGFEGEVLKGATETLKHIDIIYTECNRGQTYEGNMEIDEMDVFLEPFGFVRVETYWPSPNWTWGDCVFISKNLL